MVIDRVETIILKRRIEKPVADSLHVYDVGGHLLTRIYTNDGIGRYLFRADQFRNGDGQNDYRP